MTTTDEPDEEADEDPPEEPDEDPVGEVVGAGAATAPDDDVPVDGS
ncbi:hypothetical protein ABZ330_08390 [Streptomyces sp. NPDC006172]